MFTTKEQEILKYGLENGKTKDEVQQALVDYRSGGIEHEQEVMAQGPGYLTRLVQHYAQAGQNVSEAIGLGGEESNLGEAIREANVARDRGDIMGAVKGFGKTALETVRVPLRTVGAVAGATFAPIIELPFVRGAIEEIGKNIISIPGVKELIMNASELAEAHPELAKDIQNIVDIATLGIGGIAERGAKEITLKAGQKIGEGAGKIGGEMGGIIGERATGVIESGKELLERVPRALERGKEALIRANERAALIQASEPAVANAIKANVDDVLIDTVKNADDVTRQAYKQVISIAEKPGIGTAKKQPSIIAGDLALKQYDLVLKQKNSIGKQIGEATKTLSKTTKVSMKDSYQQIDNILRSQGVKVVRTEKGVRFNFTGSKFTPAERIKIQELYKLATEGGDNLSPLQIRGKDQLFSKLQREARMEGVGNLIVDTEQGIKPLFSVFRDIYSSKLDTISPEIKALNAEYTKYAKLTDDLEDSIFKTPNFNVTKSADPAEFAKVNLRRIFGEAQSSPAYEAVANQMDSVARELGYEGATPKDVTAFVEMIRKYYPDTIPMTGFQGGIKKAIEGGIPGVVGKVLEIGKPGIIDQQKAIKELMNVLTKNKELSFNQAVMPEITKAKEIVGEFEKSKEKLGTQAIISSVTKDTSFKGFKDLTTEFLDYAKGKTTLSKQEIMDFARRPELKKGEADLLNKLGNELKETKVPAQEFADSIRRDLLELKPVKVKEPQYKHTTIGFREFEGRPIEQAGKEFRQGKNYEEVVFESPIATNGSTHYPNSKNYFAHARGDEVVESGKKIWREQEIQSDLLQKEGIEKLKTMDVMEANNPKINDYLKDKYGSKYWEVNRKLESVGGIRDFIKKDNPELYSEVFEVQGKRLEEIDSLNPFTNDRFGERIMRERIKEKVQKGYEKYRLPTGETIGKIEGFRTSNWFSIQGNVDEALTSETLKVGKQVYQGNTASPWIITDILGDGRFKAVSKGTHESVLKGDWGIEGISVKNYPKVEREKLIKQALDNRSEAFDLTGKSNPQARRYENWGKFLKNKFGGKEVIDPQGNSWMEIDLKPEMKSEPVKSFGMIRGKDFA